MLLAGFATSLNFINEGGAKREQRKQAILAEIEKLDPKDLIDLGSYLGDSEDLANLKTIARQTAEEVFNSLDYRDVTTWYYNEIVFYMTGGMSWGDSPTETYDCFMKFSLLPDKVLKHLL